MFLQFQRAVCLLFAATAFLWSSVSAQSTIAECSLFADGPNATWTHVLTLTTASRCRECGRPVFFHQHHLPPNRWCQLPCLQDHGQRQHFFGNPQALNIGRERHHDRSRRFRPGGENSVFQRRHWIRCPQHQRRSAKQTALRPRMPARPSAPVPPNLQRAPTPTGPMC